MHPDPRGVLTGVHFIDGDYACCEGALGGRRAILPRGIPSLPPPKWWNALHRESPQEIKSEFQFIPF